MSKQRGSSTAATAQDVGGADNGVQRERVRTGTVQMAGGRVLLSVVAAGAKSGESAARVVEQVFQTVSGARAANVSAALKRGLEIASQTLPRQGADVEAAAVAVRGTKVFFANVGNNIVFRIAGQEAIRLTRPSDSRLGRAVEPEIQAGPEAGLILQRGDRIVVASAGLVRKSPDDGRPFVDPLEIAKHIQDLPPDDAARHLVSIALGRDADGNVSVAVLGLPFRRRKKSLSALTLIAAPALAAVILIVGYAAFSGRSVSELLSAALVPLGLRDSDTTTDFGFAVLVRGGVLADVGDGAPTLVGTLDTIPVGAALSAQTDAALGMQSTFEGSTDLARGYVYLERGAALRLSEIDPRGVDGEPRSTRLDLNEGSILVSRQSGTWEYQVRSTTETAILSGAGLAAMGVGTNAGALRLDCLIGICRYESQTGEELLLSGGERIIAGASSNIVQENAIPPESVARWNEVCGGCVQGSR